MKNVIVSFMHQNSLSALIKYAQKITGEMSSNECATRLFEEWVSESDNADCIKTCRIYRDRDEGGLFSFGAPAILLGAVKNTTSSTVFFLSKSSSSCVARISWRTFLLPDGNTPILDEWDSKHEDTIRVEQSFCAFIPDGFSEPILAFLHGR